MTDQFDSDSIPPIPLENLTQETRDFLLGQTRNQIEEVESIRSRPGRESERVRLDIASTSNKLRGWFVAYGAAITLTAIQGGGAVVFFPTGLVIATLLLTCVSLLLIVVDVWYDPHRCLHEAKRWSELATSTDTLYQELSETQAKLVCWPDIEGQIALPQLPKLQLAERTRLERFMDKVLPLAASFLFLATLLIFIASVTGLPRWQEQTRRIGLTQNPQQMPSSYDELGEDSPKIWL